MKRVAPKPVPIIRDAGSGDSLDDEQLSWGWARPFASGAALAPAQINKSFLTIAEAKRLRDKAHMKFVGSHA